MFLSRFSIKKKPADIFELIGAAITVGAIKYLAEFEKRKNEILNILMHPGIGGDDDYFILSDTDEDDDSVIDEEEDGDSSDEVTDVEEEEPVKEKSVEGIQLVDTKNKNKISTATNQKSLIKINMATKKTVQVAPLKKLDQRQKQNAITGTTESVKELKERSETDMESAARKQCSSGFTKSVHPALMKRNVATQRVQVAPPQEQLHSDCSPQKQSNCSVITRPIVQKTTQSSEVARPMQKETQSISDMERFESSKRKFEERFAERKEAKRRIIMVDFHHMPKPANDPRPPKRCWARRRF